ncbi:MAG TPA: HIRAN domain-containing protein [Allosphingosinicella sp.]|jgi:hypothetical protein
MAKLPTRKKLFNLAGEGHDNPDGSSRQEELRNCEPGEPVSLEREPANSYDPNAVMVRSCRGVCIGYLAREDAAQLAPALDEGRTHRATLHELTGGLSGYKHHGARVSITWDGGAAVEHVPLDEAQLRSRAAKAKVAGRTRDAQGRLKAEGGGCMGMLALVIVVGGLALGLPI